jgi:hypothetical protein
LRNAKEKDHKQHPLGETFGQIAEDDPEKADSMVRRHSME